MKTSLYALAALSFSFTSAIAAHAAPDEPPSITPDSGPWNTPISFKFETREKKKRQALSGIACPRSSSGQRLCLAVFDEGGETRYLVIEDNAYTVLSDRVVL